MKTKARSCRFDAATRILTINGSAAHQKETRYHVSEYPADFGVAYAVVKLDDQGEPVERYDANIAPAHESCSCICGLRERQRCRHVAALLALKAAGRLS
jgi:hypothetical protein